MTIAVAILLWLALNFVLLVGWYGAVEFHRNGRDRVRADSRALGGGQVQGRL